MSLTLMYITNDTGIAGLAEKSGIDRIWIDMEYMGKEERQPGMNTVKSHHTLADISTIRKVISKSSLMVRVNPLHDKSFEEITESIRRGAEYVMLPMFYSPEDAKRFIDIVNGKAKTILLAETALAVQNIESICQLDGVDEIHVGLNDLSLSYKMKFMFELLADGTLDKLSCSFRKFNKRFGFGGIARIGYGDLPAEYIICEHYRLGSSMAILSRGFCNACGVKDISEIEDIFIKGVSDIRAFERKLATYTQVDFEKNTQEVKKRVEAIVSKLHK